jgi:hypothetical protein
MTALTMQLTGAFRPFVRRVLIGTASLLAVTAAAAYAPFAGASSANADAVVTAITRGSNEVIYGKVTFNGHGQGGATVQVLDKIGRQVGSARTNGKGVYRLVVHVASGTYTFRLRSHGKTATISHTLSKGMHLRVSATVLKHGFLFLPFFHY